MRKRVAYAQNFLKSAGLVTAVSNNISLGAKDVVIEIGAGQGVITHNLVNRCRKVIAYEIDKNLYKKLVDRFSDTNNIQLILDDFLNCHLPRDNYKVFANIPFRITADVIKKLTFATNPPSDCYLIVQREAAEKYCGKPYAKSNSQISVLLKPWFNSNIVYQFSKSDFYPQPAVDVVLLRIAKRDKPLISDVHKTEYRDFIVYSFSQFKPSIIDGLLPIFGRNTMLKLSKNIGFNTKLRPSELDLRHWLALFDYFSKEISRKKQQKVFGAYAKQLAQQSKLEKIHRTRTC